jgi:hypothetical protein
MNIEYDCPDASIVDKAFVMAVIGASAVDCGGEGGCKNNELNVICENCEGSSISLVIGWMYL